MFYTVVFHYTKHYYEEFFLLILDKYSSNFFVQVTSHIVSAIVAAQRVDFVEGDAIAVPGTNEKVFLPRKVNLAELTR